jgi:hypothetical protein
MALSVGTGGTVRANTRAFSQGQGAGGYRSQLLYLLETIYQKICSERDSELLATRCFKIRTFGQTMLQAVVSASGPVADLNDLPGSCGQSMLQMAANRCFKSQEFQRAAIARRNENLRGTANPSGREAKQRTRSAPGCGIEPRSRAQHRGQKGINSWKECCFSRIVEEVKECA